MNIKIRLEQKLKADFAPQFLEIRDDSHQHAGHAAVKGLASGETHFSITMVSSRFTGTTRLQRHQMVLQSVQPWMENPIHALQLELKAPGD